MVSGRGGLRVEPGKPKTLTWKIVGERWLFYHLYFSPLGTLKVGNHEAE